LYDKQINSHYRHSDESIVQLMKKVRRSNPTWGFRMIFAFLKNKGEKMGKMRVHRLYKDAGLELAPYTKESPAQACFPGITATRANKRGLGHGFPERMGDWRKATKYPDYQRSG
jgi:hypothetical protein